MNNALVETLTLLLAVLDEVQIQHREQAGGAADLLDFASVRSVAQALTFDATPHEYMAMATQTSDAIAELADLDRGPTMEPGSIDRATWSQVTTLLRTVQVALTDQGPPVRPTSSTSSESVIISSLASSVSRDSVERTRLALQAMLSQTGT